MARRVISSTLKKVKAPALHHIRIERFRRIQEALELDLESPRGAPLSTVVLAGPNGCGKTSVLEAMLLGLGQEALLQRDQEPREREVWSRTVLPEGAKIELVVSFDGAEPERWVRTRDRFTRTPAGGAAEEMESKDVSVRFPLRVEYFSSWRWPRLVGAVQPLSPGRFPAPTEANRLWRVKRRIIDERARLGFEQQALPGVGRADVWLARINDVWRAFHGDDGLRIDVRLVEPEAGVEEEGLQGDLFVVRGDDRVCSVDQLSSGELELLAMAEWFVVRDVANALVLMDEPELHMHAQWQAGIVRAMRQMAREAQLVLATHSPIIWDQALGFERFLLVPDDDPRSREWREARSARREARSA